MLRRPKRHQNPPLMVAPFCGQMKYRSASFGAGFPCAWAAQDTESIAAASRTSRMILMRAPPKSSGREGDPESVRWISNVGVVAVAVGRTDVALVILP